MIDLETESVIKFAEAARLVPLEVHRATVARWAKTGVRGIRLECLIIAGRTVTTKEALDRFLAACRERRWIGIAKGDWLERAFIKKERLGGLVRGNEGIKP